MRSWTAAILVALLVASAASARDAVVVRESFLQALREAAAASPDARLCLEAAEEMLRGNSMEETPAETASKIERLKSRAGGENPFKAIRALVRLGEPALFVLSEILLTDETSARRLAASAIGAVGSKLGTLALVQVVCDGPRDARLASVRALVRISDARCLPFLIALQERAKPRLEALRSGAMDQGEVSAAMVEEDLPQVVAECRDAIKAIKRVNLPLEKKKFEDALDAIEKELHAATASWEPPFNPTADAAEKVLEKALRLRRENPESNRAPRLVESALRVVMSDGADVLCNETREEGLDDLRRMGLEAVAWVEKSGLRVAVLNFGEPRTVRVKLGFFSGMSGRDRELIEAASAALELDENAAGLVRFLGVPRPPPEPKGRWVADRPSCLVTAIADEKELAAELLPQGRYDHTAGWRVSDHVVRGDSFSVSFGLDRTMIVHVQSQFASRWPNEVECRVDTDRNVRKAKHGWFVEGRDFSLHVDLRRVARPDVLDMRTVFTRMSDAGSICCQASPGPRVIVLAPGADLKTVDIRVPGGSGPRSWPKPERFRGIADAARMRRRLSRAHIGRLLRRLDDADEDVRARAASELAGAESEAAVTALVARLEDENETDRVKGVCLHALAEAGEKAEGATPACARLLESQSQGVRRAALWALTRFADARAADVAAAQLWDGDAEVRRLAACVLGRASADEAVDPLVYALDDGDEQVRQRAAIGLRGLGIEVEDLGGHIYFLPEIPEKKREAARSKTDAQLVEAFAEADWQLRHAALQEVTRRPSAAIVPHLAKGAGDPRPRVRLCVVRALARTGGNAATEALAARLDDRDTTVRRTAAELAAESNQSSLREAWMRALESSDWLVRAKAAEALGRLGAREAAADLRKGLSDPRREIRLRAIRALGEIGDPEAAPLLAAAVKGGMTDEERRALAGALVAIGEPSVAPTLGLFEDGHGRVRDLASEILVAIGEPARGPLAEAVRSRHVTADESYIALAKTGGEGTAELLLGSIRRRGRGSIQSGIEEALEMLGESAVPALRDAVEHGTARQRTVAAGVLARRGDRSARRLLTDALSDADWDVKARAAGLLHHVATLEELPALLEATKAHDCPQTVFRTLERLVRDEKSIRTLESRLLTPAGEEVARILERITGKKYRYVGEDGNVHDPDARTREPQTAVEAGVLTGTERMRFDFEDGRAPGWTGGKPVANPARGKYSLELAPSEGELRLASPSIGYVVNEGSWLSLRLSAPPHTQFGVCIVTDHGRHTRIVMIERRGWTGFACPLIGMGMGRRKCGAGETVARIEIRAFQRASRDVSIYVDDIIIIGREEPAPSPKKPEGDAF